MGAVIILNGESSTCLWNPFVVAGRFLTSSRCVGSFETGAPLGNATNQFQRYVFPLPAGSLKGSAQQNVLEITFGAELGIDCGGRWTYSSSIDWAPVMTTHDNASKRSTFGFGIWKSVYLLRTILCQIGPRIRGKLMD